MKVQFEFDALTARIVAALQELQFAIVESKGSVAAAPVPTDNGKYSEWAANTDAIEKGKKRAAQLVIDWSVNWSENPADYENAPEQPEDRAAIISRFKGDTDLIAYLKSQNGAVSNLMELGATEQMATNIITVGSIFGAWPIVTYDTPRT